MAITITKDSATIGSTEYFIVADSTTASYQTSKCVLQVWLDLSNLASGDDFVLTIYEKVNGSTARAVYTTTFSDDVSPDHWASDHYVVGEGWEVSLQKTGGTDRSIGWSLRTVA